MSSRRELDDRLKKLKEDISSLHFDDDDPIPAIGKAIDGWGGDKKEEQTPEVRQRTAEQRLDELKESLMALASAEGELIPLMKEAIAGWRPSAGLSETGKVTSVGDGIVTVSGLQSAAYGEILLFPGGVRGMVQSLKRDELGCILFGDDSLITEGCEVIRTGKTAGIPVGEGFIGRVIDALGNPIDGKGRINESGMRMIESPAPGIIDRQPVNKPLETGILAIDSMFPIGRGQRELIIGDRQTGKTAIALDTILNQKGKGVLCIYVAIGQKASSVAHLVGTLERKGAMDYTIVVCSTAGDPAPLQYIAPYSGCAMGEYFMNSGRDVLIVYDDLSKHAVAYRSLSLLLERSPGREAYPGDVFYLHSRLLERSAHLSEAMGGGSMTALPIVETQAGDVSAYIPTNIISITDGQIFLESDLFFAGQRPAVNVGLSVSRVGGDAQTKAMKRSAGALRIELAQYREMEVFTQFSSDLDKETKSRLNFGEGLYMLLKQEQYSHYTSLEQVIILSAAMAHLFENCKVKQIPLLAKGLTEHIKTTLPAVCSEISDSGKLSDEDKAGLLEAAKEYINNQK